MKNFGIRELIPCVDGHCRDQRCGYDESIVVKVPSEVIKNTFALIEEVLDPAREALGKPIYVSSGYRCPLKNAAVGGVQNSQHIKGEAADIHCHDNARLAHILVEQDKFDQLILYPTFLHVSHKRSGGNRHRVLRKVASGYAVVNPETI